VFQQFTRDEKMFVGRERELNLLNKLYHKNNFQMVVMYGRRRIGKTTLIKKFIEDKPAIFFVAQEANDKLNLELFSKQVFSFFNISGQFGAFRDWQSAFDYIAERAKEQRFILAIDEFPYAVEGNISIKSILQNVIDHKLQYTNIYIILCGSHMSFMENEVMGYRSPLYGRRTSQLKLEGFDYLDSAKMLEGYGKEDIIKFYCCVGGTPHYIAQIDKTESFEQNIEELYFNASGYLYDEPMMLLQQELREPAMYNSVISAIAAGASKLNEISQYIGEERSKCIKYLQTLMNLKILHKEFPFGADEATSRKGIYKISDNCYNFWYRYVFPNKSSIEQGTGSILLKKEIIPSLSTYIGKPFEEICRQYLIRRNNNGQLPFTFTNIGCFWGAGPDKKTQVEIDIVAASRAENSIIYGECKWKNEKIGVGVLNELIQNSEVLSGYQNKYYMLFSTSGFTEGLKNTAKTMGNVELVDLDKLFHIP